MIIITSPSLDPKKNVSGVSSVTQFIMDNNKIYTYTHFQIGKTDAEHSFIKRIIRIMYSLFLWVVLMLKSNTDTIVHYNFPLSNFSIIRDSFFIGITRLFKIKIVLHIHGGVFLTAKEPSFVINWLLKRVLEQDMPIIVLSEIEKETLCKRYHVKNLIVLPNCVNIDSTYERVDDSLSSNMPLQILFLGRIARDKGIEYIYQSALELKAKGVPFNLHFAGEEKIKDQYISRFRESFGDCFSFHGITSGEAKNTLFKQADIFLLPSFYEGLPMALLEAMSWGVVPVVTNVGSIASVVLNNENGVFIKDRDAADITQTLLRLIDKPNLRQCLARNARQTILDNFDSQSYISQLNTIYKSLKPE